MKKFVNLMLPIFLILNFCSSSSSTISGDDDITDFFYLVLQWPGSQCSTKQGCCQPKTAKPIRGFTIAGLQPFNTLGSFPEYCDSHSHFNISKISNLIQRLGVQWPSLACPSRNNEKLWSDEWQKYGTCSESILNEHVYFRTALALSNKANLLKVLGIQPNGSFYELDKISDAIVNAGLHFPGIVCNKDKYGYLQLSQVYLCANYNGKSIVECPGIPLGSCTNSIKFPHF